MKTGLNHAVRVTVAALSIVLGLGAAVPAAAQCPGDVVATGGIDGTDLAAVLGAWGTNGQGALVTDLDGDGIVDGADLSFILANWGPCLRGPNWAWGDNGYGQCNIPTDLGPCTAIAGGGRHTVALRADGTVRAWGDNQYGQCNIPTDLGPCTAIAGGWLHTISLRTDGTVRAWGRNIEGQCFIPTDLGPCTAIAGGDRFTIAIPR